MRLVTSRTQLSWKLMVFLNSRVTGRNPSKDFGFMLFSDTALDNIWRLSRGVMVMGNIFENVNNDLLLRSDSECSNISCKTALAWGANDLREKCISCKRTCFFGASMIPSISHAMSVENEMESGIVVVPGFTPTNSHCQQKIILWNSKANAIFVLCQITVSQLKDVLWH